MKIHIFMAKLSWLYSTIWVCSMTLKYVNYIMWRYQTKQEYSFTIHAFKLTLVNLGRDILPTLFTWIIVRLGNIHRKHYSFYCSQNILFIIAISLKIPTLFTIFIPFKLALFIIFIGVNFFVFPKFLPMKVS